MEAGLLALRERRTVVQMEDFKKAKCTVMEAKKGLSRRVSTSDIDMLVAVAVL